MLSYLISGIAYGFAAAVTPGPLSMFLMSHAVSRGWKKTLPAAFSPLISDGPVAVLVLTILSKVPAELVQYLRLPGGAFILYLAFGAWKSWRSLERGYRELAESKSISRMEHGAGTDFIKRLAQVALEWSSTDFGILYNHNCFHGRHDSVVCRR